jgi:hypothetical protein
MLKKVAFCFKFPTQKIWAGFEHCCEDSNLSFVPNQSEPSTIVNAVYDWAHQFTNMYTVQLLC